MQFMVNGLINGAAYGVLGVSFALILSVTGRFHFAWSVCYMLVAFVAAYLWEVQMVPVAVACLIGLIAGIAAALAMEVLVYRPIAARSKHSVLPVFVASVGLTIFGVALLRFLDFGSTGLGSHNLLWVPLTSHTVGSITYSTLDLVSVIVLAAVTAAVWAALILTPLGRQIAAVRVNPTMARIVGIRDARTYLYVYALATAAAGVPALFAAMRFSATPEMGASAVFYAFVVAFVAGIGRGVWTTFAVGVGLGAVEGVSLNWLSPAMQTTVVFGVLLVYVVVKAASASGIHTRLSARRLVPQEMS